MKLKKKYQLLLFSAIISVPLLILVISVLMSVIYDIVSKNSDIPFHESYAYPTMLILFLLSFFILAFLFSRSINSLLNKINMLNKVIRDLASDDKIIPNKIEVKSDDEIGALIRSVNLLIERTTFRELELKQQEEINRELLTKLRHDINTPLTAMKLQLFYLEEEFKDQAPILESLNNQIEYIAGLTNEFNLQSTDTLESSYVVMDEVNINALLETMVNKWNYLYSIYNIQLIYITVDKDLVWVSNGLWLQRLFDNIFQNTLRHSKASKFEVSIENYVVTIRDNGVGFNMNNKGIGLGLKIIDDIARILNIKYTLQSNNNGTLFCFTIENNVFLE
ncbi:sensor histidine kinase [Viridibacillus sp. NPDC096237]|uniref:sensor histidine kinase n=1 Tax=Viridibacillus sp. NPDC096237 TaxID=3390721 RepID=UPI003D01BFBB